MAEGNKSISLGELVAVRKQFKDKDTGEVRAYFGYEIEFENGAKVRFMPLQDDRSLLKYVMSDLIEE